jgi:hypothetical protein
VALVMALPGESLARRGVPIENYDNVPVVRSDRVALTDARMRDGIVRGAQRNKWIVLEDTPGRIVASLSIHGGKHSMTVEIRYGAGTFSIDYRDSHNLNYGTGTSGPIVHPTYNKEVKGLLDAINAELQRI